MLTIGKQLSNVRAHANDNAELTVKCTEGNFVLSPKAAEGLNLFPGEYVFLFVDAESNKHFIVKGYHKDDEGNKRGTLGHKLAGSKGSNLSFSGTLSWRDLKGDTDLNKTYAIAGLTEGYSKEDGYFVDTLEGFGEDREARELIFVREEPKIQKDFSKKSEESEEVVEESEKGEEVVEVEKGEEVVEVEKETNAEFSTEEDDDFGM